MSRPNSTWSTAIDRSVGYDRCMQSPSAATALAKSSRREEILQIAARLFAENGYHGTGIAELGEAVGLGKGALYHHIGSKDDLLYEISSRHVIEMVAFGEQLLASDISPLEKFRRLTRRLMRTIADNLPQRTGFFRAGR